MSFLQLLSDDKPRDEQDTYAGIRSDSFPVDELEMVLSSRSCFSSIEEIPFVNSSVLNYGIDEAVIKTIIHKQQLELITEYIHKVILRFEPRLSSVVVKIQRQTTLSIYIEISALYKNHPFKIEISWGIESGRFYFSE